MTTTTELWTPGTGNNGLLVAALTVMSTELNGLANNGVALSSVGGTSGLFTNSNTGQALWGPSCPLKLGGALTTALSAGAYIAGWMLPTLDGSSFEYGTTTGSATSGSTTLGSLGTINGISYISATASQGTYIFDLTNPADIAVGTYVNGAPSGASLAMSAGAVSAISGDTIAFINPPQRPPDFVWSFEARVYMSGESIVPIQWPRVTPLNFKMLTQNNLGSSGGTLPSSGTTIQLGLSARIAQ